MYHTVHYFSVPRSDTKQQLLDGAVEYVATHGIGELSLRSLAAALGTSHRMLIHHFGSKERLWVQIVQAVEQRERVNLLAALPDQDLAPAETMRANWRHISDPALWPNERLFFELYGQALQGRAHTAEVLDGIVDDWVDPLAELSIAKGMPAADARAQARLAVAVTRGLLLDLLATKDVDGVNAAMEAFIGFHDAWLRQASASQPTRTPAPAACDPPS